MIYEVVLEGFCGSIDGYDDSIKWIKAESEQAVRDYLEENEVHYMLIQKLPDSFVEYDFEIPSD